MKLFVDEKILKFTEEKILSLSVLDPTMGSGHFLVNATNHIANFIVELLNEYLGYNSKIDSNTAFWRRRVIENCIYGVDLNPLAVELAKLCLWITTAFKEKPLSFLNHRLKQGNALVDVSISDLEKFLEKSESKPSLFMQAYINCIREAAEGYKEKLSCDDEGFIDSIDMRSTTFYEEWKIETITGKVKMISVDEFGLGKANQENPDLATVVISSKSDIKLYLNLQRPIIETKIAQLSLLQHAYENNSDITIKYHNRPVGGGKAVKIINGVQLGESFEISPGDRPADTIVGKPPTEFGIG
ncbi:unnamed protein product [marine sediment metagenome]|uniref:site-specific DNA-methyltransferase (adenine-specific) n=1 Tax=marine sediment metagenome TaxID=412755 RepID=X1A5Z4_9ZZZZ